ncbi:n peptide/opine/nickel uptake ABC transporter ATP-binding protein [Nitrospirillum viridazoti Y2]|nr:n peptide/opine/nickel uptake ABC transporter ATP-binding protein [Nitrospirillum amazonense Y2]
MRRARVEELLAQVGLAPADADRHPQEFSGGQRQRIAIARALVVQPDLIALDEATSALDVLTRAQILDLLGDLSRRLGLAYLVVSHDLAVVRALTDRLLVMQGGRIVEEGPTPQVLSRPQHPYTASLLAATPTLAAHVA